MENFSVDSAVIMLICIFIALVLILINSYRRKKSFEEEAVMQAIKSSYELFHKLSLQVQKHWGLSHLSVVSFNSYVESRTIINTIIQEKIGTKKNKANETLVACKHRERNMIINLLIFYEQIFYLSKNSNSRAMRKKFLKLINRYFTERLLLNPRIVYFVLNNDGGTDLHIEKESYYYLISKYKQYLKNEKNKLTIDVIGPIHKKSLKNHENRKKSEDPPIDGDIKNIDKNATQKEAINNNYLGFIHLETEDDLWKYLEGPRAYMKHSMKKIPDPKAV